MTDSMPRKVIEAAIPAEWSRHPDGLTAEQRTTLRYAGLKEANAAIGGTDIVPADADATCALLRRAAIIDPSLFHLMLLHYTLGIAPIQRFGNPAQSAALLSSLAELDAVCCPLITEPARSNSHLGPRTTATYDPATGGFVLHTPDPAAVKSPSITANPGIAKTGAVFARLIVSGHDHGVFVFVTPLRHADGTVGDGVTITPLPETTSLHIDCAMVCFDHVAIPFEAWLADGSHIEANGTVHDPVGGDAARLTRTMSIGSLVWRALTAASAGIATAASAVALRYSADHRAMGALSRDTPLIRYGNQQDAVFSAVASASVLSRIARYALRPSLADGDGAAASWVPWSSVDRELALLKAVATDTAERVVSSCRSHCGANGYTNTDLFHSYRAMAHAYTTAGGDNELILLETGRIAALANEGPAAGAVAMDPAGDPAAGERAVDECLGLAAKAEALLARRLRAAVGPDRDDFAAWNGQLGLAADVASLAADHLVLEILADGVGQSDGVPDETVQDLCDMYALEWAERRASVLFDLELLRPGAVAAIRAARLRLCEGLVGRIDHILDALDVPEELFLAG